MTKIAYLFGAGAAQGEVNQTGGRQSILMYDFVAGIINTISEYTPEQKLPLADVTNYLTEELADLIWDKARELLDCDVLRIIGSSLSMNDWELVSLVHTTQKLRKSKRRSPLF